MTKDERRKKFFKEHPQVQDVVDEWLERKRFRELLKALREKQKGMLPRPSTLERLYKKKVEYMHFADARLSGKSMIEIGKEEGISRERVRQILRQYFSDIQFPRYKHGNPKAEIISPCGRKGCVNQIKEFRYPSLKGRKYCSYECNMRAQGNRVLPIHVSQMTPEQFRVFNNQRTKDYYHLHKYDKGAFERRREHNIRSRNRKKLKNETKKSISPRS